METKKINKCVELRHELHKNAEHSQCETQTMNLLKKFIKENTSLKIVNKEGYFYAVHYVSTECPNIAFRADMDAVPVDENLEIEYNSLNKGVSHKCGHDGHSTVLAGFGMEVEKIKNKNIFLLFQPGEEIGTGAKNIVLDEFLIENKIDEIYGFHNVPGFEEGNILCKENVFACASKGMIIKLQGTPSHAAYPEYGVNPSYAVADIIKFLNEVTKLNIYSGMVLCTIVNVDIGERAFGTSASAGQIMITIRAEEETDLNILQNKIEEFVSKVSQDDKIKHTIEFCDEFPETRNHKECVDKIKNICSTNSFIYENLERPVRWSEDFGYYTKGVKGAIFGIGSGKNHPQLHTSQYDFPDSIIERAIEMFYFISK